MQTSVQSLMAYYDNQDDDGVSRMLDYFLVTAEPLPFSEFIEIFSDTNNEFIRNKIRGVMLVRIRDFMPESIELYKTTTEPDIKLLMMQLLTSELNTQNILFLVDHYIRIPAFRDEIFNLFTQSTESVLLGFSSYLELYELTFDQEELIVQFLSEIDPDIFYKNADTLGYLKISDLFYSVPPDIRKKQWLKYRAK